MPGAAAHNNLVIAWLWILVGFVVGLYLGLNFHKENWLGGYASMKRRMYRLGHISFFGLGVINLLFYFTVAIAGLNGISIGVASTAFVVGAVSMPMCCFAMAQTEKVRLLFGLPIASLLLAGSLTLMEIIR